MALTAGTRLGTYEILVPIGAGGMGTGQKVAKAAKAPTPKKDAKASKKAAKPAAKDASTPRSESKGAKILALIGRAQSRKPWRRS
jgi:hypothetical protein